MSKSAPQTKVGAVCGKAARTGSVWDAYDSHRHRHPQYPSPQYPPRERPGASPGLLEAAEKADAANRLRPSAAKAGLIFKSITYGLKAIPFKNLSFSAASLVRGERVLTHALKPW
jgi:hypothetical protein